MAIELGKTSNIIRNEIVPPSRTHDADGWQIPVCEPSQVAFALKSIRSAEPQRIEDIVAAISAIGREASWISDDELKLIASRTGAPIKFLRFTIGRVNRWMAQFDQFVSAHGKPQPNGGLRRGDVIHTGGLPTMLILAGDSSALPAWSLAHVLLANANAVVKPSNVEPLSAFLFLKAVIAKGIRAPHLLHFNSAEEQDRLQIRKLITNTQQSIIYGEDRTVGAVYEGLPFTAAHKPIPYWSGRSGVVVYPDADLEVAARSIIEGACEDRGNKCVSTKKVFASAPIVDELVRLLAREADKLNRGDPLAETTELGRLDPTGRAMAQRYAAEGDLVYDRDVMIVRCGEGAELVRQELPYPIIAVIPTEPDQLLAKANASVAGTPTGRALVMSVFTSANETFQTALATLAATKVLWNQPTTYLDLNAMHQGVHLFLELMRQKAC